jgi:hypothetical protein
MGVPLPPPEKIRLIEEVDRRTSKEERAKMGAMAFTEGLASIDAKPKTVPQPRKSAAQTAEILGVSRATVERARVVLDHTT